MILAGPLGNVMLGKGMRQIGTGSLWPHATPAHTVLAVMRCGSIWLGIGSLGVFFIANMLVLSWADYSFVQPASSLAYGVVAVLGFVLLGERISPMHWLGIAVICLGVLVVGRTAPRTTVPPAAG